MSVENTENNNKNCLIDKNDAISEVKSNDLKRRRMFRFEDDEELE